MQDFLKIFYIKMLQNDEEYKIKCFNLKFVKFNFIIQFYGESLVEFFKFQIRNFWKLKYFNKIINVKGNSIVEFNYKFLNNLFFCYLVSGIKG